MLEKKRRERPAKRWESLNELKASMEQMLKGTGHTLSSKSTGHISHACNTTKLDAWKNLDEELMKKNTVGVKHAIQITFQAYRITRHHQTSSAEQPAATNGLQDRFGQFADLSSANE